MSDERAGVGEGPDASPDGIARDEAEEGGLSDGRDANELSDEQAAARDIDKDDPHKVKKLVKLGHDEDEQPAKASE